MLWSVLTIPEHSAQRLVSALGWVEVAEGRSPDFVLVVDAHGARGGAGVVVYDGNPAVFVVNLPTADATDAVDAGRLDAVIAEIRASIARGVVRGPLLNKVMDALPDAFFFAEHDGRVAFANGAAHELLGTVPGSLLGRQMDSVALFSNIVPRPGSSEARCSSTAARDWGRLDLSDGSHIFVERSDVAIRDAEGNPHCRLITVHENGAQQEYEAAQRASIRDAEQLAQAKTYFLANMSHELRTPLNSIIGMAELALDRTQDSEQEEYLSILKKSADGLLELISSILDYSKIESGGVFLNSAPFDLAETLYTTVGSLAVQAHRKGLGLHIVVDPELPARLVGDSPRIQQILINLVANAIKFTNRGEVVLSVRYNGAAGEAGPEKKVNVEFRVKDTGIGIPAEKVDSVFRPFTQGDDSPVRRFGGVGIGLSITKALIELMGGTLAVSTRSGAGSDFVFSLAFGVESDRPTKEQPRLDSSFAVCVVTESPGMRSVLLPWLAKIGVTVHDFSSMGEFVGWFSAHGTVCKLLLFDAEVSDRLILFREHDESMIKALRRHNVVLIARMDNEENTEWQKFGLPVQRLREPVKMPELFDLLASVAIGNVDEPAPVRPAVPAKTEVKGLRILLAEDDAINRLVNAKMLQRVGHQVETAEHGRAALATLRLRPFDLLIVDIEMPGLDGYEVAKVVRSGDVPGIEPAMPIIALTAHASDQDRQHADIVGMNAFISKPFVPYTLYALIDRVYAEVAGRSQTLRPDAAGTAAVGAAPGSAAVGATSNGEIGVSAAAGTADATAAAAAGAAAEETSAAGSRAGGRGGPPGDGRLLLAQFVELARERLPVPGGVSDVLAEAVEVRRKMFDIGENEIGDRLFRVILACRRGGIDGIEAIVADLESKI